MSALTTLSAALAALYLGARPTLARAEVEHAPFIEILASDGLPVLADGAPWRLLYLDFWASWCTPCRLSFPWMNEMQARHAAAGLRIVALNLDKREADARRFLQQFPARFAVALDPAAESARKLAIQAMPTSLLIARDRRILFTHRGFRLEDGADIEARVKAALG